MTHSLSPRLQRGRLLRTTSLLLTTGAVAVVALVGCASDAPGTGSSASSTPGSTTDATSLPDPTPTPTSAGTPVAQTCDQVLTLDDIYAFNPNFGTAPDFEPSLSAGQTAAEFQGLNCGLLNQSSGEIVEISVTQPNDVLLAQLKNEALSSGQIVPTYGTPPTVEGYFSAADGTGVAQAFTPTYWITVGSPEFFEPGDAEALVAAVIANLQ
ncbi:MULTISPECIES: iron ABC transporter ATP-binding protein [Cryobacterium]|uniref:Iron ABC transporter ATP-binding protein n=1 Tax=Cryobacterium breve TaxID=1259258 RepID=A0ABY2J4E6_9MICO|nr:MULTISPECIES: iron ABC transporter ATP-binding protein [Cryobacterium]TFC90903.1 iron ABC transporter ATP-binding protein [Cryobacterium sp. TmT3-12]TFC99222.1 iron ABC transporter ATP-binding protein [Cryobacterium breve]